MPTDKIHEQMAAALIVHRDDVPTSGPAFRLAFR
jgi:hypothetical protein